MKIVDLKTFLAYPDGVVFAEYRPCMLGDIEIRGAVWPNENVRYSAYQSFDLFDVDMLTDPDMSFEPGDESHVVTDEYRRNGPGLDPDQLYAIFDKKDIETVIQRLQRAYKEAKE